MSPRTDDLDALAAWFTREVAALAPELRRYPWSRFGPQVEVEDVMQETFMGLWRAAMTREIRAPRAVLYVAARNHAVSALRQRRTVPVDDITHRMAVQVADDGPDIPDQLELRRRRRLLDRAVASLPPRARDVLVLCRIEGKRHGEVARTLGISTSTVETHMRRALRGCAEFVAAEPA